MSLTALSDHLSGGQIVSLALRCFDRTLAFMREQVADLSGDDMVLQPPGVPNHAAWTLGHFIHSCEAIARELGVRPWLPANWESRFGYGSTPVGLTSDLAAALLLVGVVSGTLLRHVVQILPIIAAAGLVARRPNLGAWAAAQIFVFWIVIVVLIWLFLLGLSRIANGRYTVIEIACTFLMAGSSAAVRRRADLPDRRLECTCVRAP